MSVDTLEKKKRTTSVPPWGIEASNPRNGDVLLRCLINARLRSELHHVKEVFGRPNEEGDLEKLTAPADIVPGVPSSVPGQQVHVNPAEGTWVISDPLREDKRTCEQLQKAIKTQTPVNVGDKLRGVPSRKGKLNPDQMKTLVREMKHLVDANLAKVVKGIVPDHEDIDEMSGDYLVNPTGTIKNTMPRHEKDLPEWEQTLNRVK